MDNATQNDRDTIHSSEKGGIAMQGKARSPRNVQYLRKSNRGAILRKLAELKQSTRVELAGALGLTKMAISTIVADLVKEGLVEECGQLLPEEGQCAQGIGRKPMALRIPPMRVNLIGLLLTRHEIQCLAMDLSGARIGSATTPIPERITNAEFEAMLVSEVGRMLRAHRQLTFVGIGVSSLGPLDIEEQVLLYPPNFRGLGGVKIGRLLKREFHLPVYMDNDMNCCALAEQFYGVGRQTANMIYVGFGSGVGAGVILGGAMLHGGNGFAGELGHVSTDLDGPLCSCGQRGCLEMYTSTGALLRGSGAADIAELRQLARQTAPPPMVRQCMDDYLRAINNALVTVANLFDPDIIIVGDEHGLLGAAEMEMLRQNLNARMFQHGFKTIRIEPNGFGTENALVGGAALVAQEIFRGKLAL